MCEQRKEKEWARRRERASACRTRWQNVPQTWLLSPGACWWVAKAISLALLLYLHHLRRDNAQRTASKLISLSSFSAFLSQDKHMPDYDSLPCLSGCDAYVPRQDVCLSTWWRFVFCSTSLAVELLGRGFVYLIGRRWDIVFYSY